MGLDITCPRSDSSYSYSYGALHRIRAAAYALCGGESSMGFLQQKDFDWSHVLTAARFPNLIIHSDCGGSYTMDGKIDFDSKDLLTGSLPGLYEELKELKEKGDISGVETQFENLFRVVEDAFYQKSCIQFS